MCWLWAIGIVGVVLRYAVYSSGPSTIGQRGRVTSHTFNRVGVSTSVSMCASDDRFVFRLNSGGRVSVLVLSVRVPGVSNFRVTSCIGGAGPGYLVVFVASRMGCTISKCGLSVFEFIPGRSKSRELGSTLLSTTGIVSLRDGGSCLVRQRSVYNVLPYGCVLCVVGENGGDRVCRLGDGRPVGVQGPLSMIFRRLSSGRFVCVSENYVTGVRGIRGISHQR